MGRCPSVLTDDSARRRLSRVKASLERDGGEDAIVGSTCAAASPVHETAYVPPFPDEVMSRPFEPRQLPPGGVHVGSIGLDLVPVPATTPVRIPLAGALALFDPEGDRAHGATRGAGRLVIASD